MHTSPELFEKPKFRGGVVVTSRDIGIEIDYRQQGCVVDVAPDVREEALQLFAALQDGISTTTLVESFPKLSDQLPEIIEDLDRLGLLEEAECSNNGDIITGKLFYREISDFVARAEQRICHSSLFHALEDSIADREVLINYVVQYFHIVRACPAIVGQALAHCGTSRTYSILRDYYSVECGHDGLLAQSLNAVGLFPSDESLPRPLPATFAIIAALTVLARQDPLSFKAALFIMERPQPEFHRAFHSRCLQLGLPDAFFNPVLEHSGINDAGIHEDITRLLLSEISFVSREEQVVVKKNIHHLIECLDALEGQLLAHPRYNATLLSMQVREA